MLARPLSRSKPIRSARNKLLHLNFNFLIFNSRFPDVPTLRRKSGSRFRPQANIGTIF